MSLKPFYSYSSEYLERVSLKYTLVRAFLVEAPKNLLDISYTVEDKELIIQVVLIHNTTLEDEVRILSQLQENLPNLSINLHKLFVSKEDFNKDRGCWLPTSYKWLEYLLFSKAEVL
ncbi:hypothetical protein Aasi_0413 [Candidatus Amoebophilus asiaticus 5a2]|uniref:Uncharacterized protein n=1 Tax=Amoebophilus asiaticus (strain 5a2) TaxID=452471 RepID=B3ERH7_AMOA5|nr:hypothetical protein [Candidatus Amoebophilus asiaticus]ACE05829.1 hypothetical protein Aasi_0413 [Candidatus Amoebophilus asiaticus 5a2]